MNTDQKLYFGFTVTPIDQTNAKYTTKFNGERYTFFSTIEKSDDLDKCIKNFKDEVKRCKIRPGSLYKLRTKPISNFVIEVNESDISLEGIPTVVLSIRVKQNLLEDIDKLVKQEVVKNKNIFIIQAIQEKLAKSKID